jgi:hypothetical protein
MRIRMIDEVAASRQRKHCNLEQSNLVSHRERALSTVEGLLSEDSGSLKTGAMLADGMAELLLEDPKLLQSFVDCFMACTGFVLGSLVSMGHKLTRHAALRVSVGAICFHHFVWQQVIGKLGLEDFQVRPGPCRKGSIDPNNIASLNAHTYLIAKACTSKLV